MIRTGDERGVHGGAEVLEWLASLFPVHTGRGRPLAVMFTDIAGFTAVAARDGDRAALRLLHGHDAAVLPALRDHMGRMLKRLGDGLMAAFSQPRDAVAAALAMQRTAARRGEVRLRIGIHVGAASARAGDLVGHDVNVAARIAERATGGVVLVSDAVRAAALGLPVRFRRAPALRVAGRPVGLFSVHDEKGGRS